MGRSANLKQNARKAEKLRPQLSPQLVEVQRALNRAKLDPEVFLMSACGHLERVGVKFELSPEFRRNLLPHFEKFLATSLEYLTVKGLPEAFSDLFSRNDRRVEQLQSLSKELRADGLKREAELLEQVAFSLWKQSFPKRKFGFLRKVSIPELQAANTPATLSRLLRNFRKVRERGPEDHFVCNFLIPGSKVLGNLRNKNLFFAELYLGFFPERRSMELTGKVALQYTSLALKERARSQTR
ncbi:MAG: hypothetical protein A2428_00980 [Bdellovibrionales bacterium RIFOXYC1_FULL_54_43]|nr:MAG: hypothetical protein A2428_00980 [Bdellovibrionales bacterium RIFOXYC1_FULL_54_43]OFZ82858.1 MAG: hypothetical protein A2603_11705 [Bdellovibrionales bacterium RIFOXYD1_FULL_55_31]